jgi:hypothetical protein
LMRPARRASANPQRRMTARRRLVNPIICYVSCLGAPGPWPQTVLLMYGRVSQLPPNQIYHTWILEKAWPEYSSFVNSVATSGGWSASIPQAFISFE